MTRLERLLRPRSIAVVGGGAWCASVVEQCRKIGFDGAVWPVHPKRAELAGLPTVADVRDLPGPPDAVFVGVNRDLTIDVVAALAEMGAGGAVCFASGFLEAQAETGDGADKQAALLRAAGDMPILGPNCYGFINYLDGAALWPDQHGGLPCSRGVAIVTQSSNIAINLTMQTRGLPLAYVVTAGNQAQTGLSEIARAVLYDDRVTALGLHIEGIDDLPAFEAMAREAHRMGKPVVAVKIGRSVQAQAATVSHTASLAGSDAGAAALLERLGIGRASSLSALLETLKLLHVTGPLQSNRIASMSCSGGEASLFADSAHGRDLCFPALSVTQYDGLRAALGPRVALANPLDYHTYIWGDLPAMTDTFTAMMGGDLALGCVVLDFPRGDRCDAQGWEPVITAVARAQDRSGRPMAILSSLPECLPEDVAARLIDMGITPLAGMGAAVEAIEIAAWLGTHAPVAEDLLPPAVAPSSVRTMTEAQAKAQLAAHGVQVPQSRDAADPQAAEHAARDLGCPVVLKGEGLAHKSEAGAVVVNLTSPELVSAAARAMLCGRFLVEQMVTGTVAELLVGVVADPAHGYVLTLAAGGVQTELLQDSACLLVPASRAAVETALDGLRIAPVLRGFRGQAGADMAAVVDAIMAVQAYVALARPLEIEINPLMCGPNGAIAADALIRIGD
ncbi:acetate--CoA ligase family protein [Sagittula sp. SSi028]|uniref:acetate--CoA ligase family protein n=1 Tax=Sagittula sp. SSi028 TaxID=3400636 RepID=UPI003AF7AE08